MRVVLLLVLLAGCQRIFKLDHVDEVPDASTDVTADAAGDAPRPGDATGFCWDPQQTTNDDDGDGVVDGCDPCPGNPDMNPQDSDGDNIPDVCDPEVGHNTILGFLPLSQLGPHWMGSGQWGVQGTDLQQADGTSNNALINYDTSIASDTWVQVGIIGPQTPTAQNTIAGLYLNSANSTMPAGGLTCDLTRTTSASGTFLAATYWSNGNPMLATGTQLGVVPAVWVSGRLSTGTCVAQVDGTVHIANAPAGETRRPFPSLYTSFSTGIFTSMTWFSSAI